VIRSGVSISDVVGLASSFTENAEDRLEGIYTRACDRAATFAWGSFKVAGLILAPLLAAVFDSNSRIDTWAVILYLGGAAVATIGGLNRILRIPQLEKERFAALRLYDQIQRHLGRRP